MADLRYFGLSSLSDDMMGILHRRVIEAAFIASPAAVRLDGKLIEIDGMRGFMKSYLPSNEADSAAAAAKMLPVAQLGPRWQVIEHHCSPP